MNRLFIIGQFDSFNFLEFLDAALHLLGLGGLIAEAINESFQVMNPVLLIFVGGFELRPALRLLREIFVIIAGVKICALVPDFENSVYRYIQKIAVVRNNDEGVGIFLQILFQPVAR